MSISFVHNEYFRKRFSDQSLDVFTNIQDARSKVGLHEVFTTAGSPKIDYILQDNNTTLKVVLEFDSKENQDFWKKNVDNLGVGFRNYNIEFFKIEWCDGKGNVESTKLHENNIRLKHLSYFPTKNYSSIEKSLSKVNVFYGDRQQSDNLRDDSQGKDGPGDYGLKNLIDLSNRYKDKEFLVILDHGEHFSLEDNSSNLHIFRRHYDSAFYNFYGNPMIPYTPIKEKWLFCAMGRSSYARTRVFEQIHKDKFWRENSHYSYLCTNYPEREPSKSDFKSTGGSKEFESDIPFNNFEADILSNAERHSFIPWSAMNSCLFAIIVETGETANIGWYSEKTYNALFSGMIPIVIGGPYSMSQISQLGFRLPSFIDYTLWDRFNIDTHSRCSHTDKIKLVFEMLDGIKDNNSLEDLCKEWTPMALWNRQYFENGFKERSKKEDEQLKNWINSF